MATKNYTTSMANPTTPTLVRYDARRRTWAAVNGVTTETGPGPEGKREAFRLMLLNDYPALCKAGEALARYHHNNEQIVSRLIKAAALLIDGHVYAGEVRSEHDANRFYRVRFDGIPATYECTCEDHASGRAPHSVVIGGRVCKHALAQHLAFLLAIELPKPPIPFDGEATHVVAFGDEFDGGTRVGDIYEEIEF